MNLQQLEYIIAVEQEKNFVKAASKCFITQATLSMMIKKLEDELGLKIFDRSKQPVMPTREGQQIIDYAKRIIGEASMLKEFAGELKGEIAGELRLGVIPTLAPYLLPLFLKEISRKIPQMKIKIRELITEDIIRMIKHGEMDAGLLATPLHDPLIAEHPLFYEEFFAYAAQSEKLPQKKYILPAHIKPDHLWLLEEGHCMRNQLVNFCSLKKQDETSSLYYEAGSIETLINLVDMGEGITILPRLATLRLSASQKKKLREFAPPKPAREISLITRLHFPRKKLLHKLMNEITASVKKNIAVDGKGMRIIDLQL